MASGITTVLPPGIEIDMSDKADLSLDHCLKHSAYPTSTSTAYDLQLRLHYK